MAKYRFREDVAITFTTAGSVWLETPSCAGTEMTRKTFDHLFEIVPEPTPESPYQRAARLQSEAIAAAHEALGDLADRGAQVKAILESVFGRKG